MRHRSQPLWIVAVLLGTVVFSMVGAGLVAATGSVVPTVASTIRNDANEIITKAQWEKTDVHVHVVVSGSAGTPTGNIQVRVFSGNLTCAGSMSSTIGLVLTNGAVDAPLGTPATIGTFSFRAVYQGNATYAAKGGACLPLTVIKQKPVVKTVIRDASGTAGTVFSTGVAVHDSGTVTGVGGTPTDAVYVTFYTDDGCSTASGLVAVAILSSGSFNALSSSHTFAKPGIRSFRAEYKGDAHFQDVVGSCEPFTIKAPPTIKSQVYGGTTPETTITVGPKISDRVVLTSQFGTPTGKVFAQLFDNGTCTGMPTYQSQNVVLSGGVASVAASFGADPDALPAAGSHAFKAFYLSDGSFLKAAGPCEPFTVVKAELPLNRISLRNDSEAEVTAVAVGDHVHVVVQVNIPTGLPAPTGAVSVVTLGPQCTGVGQAGSATYARGGFDVTSLVLKPTVVGSLWLAIGFKGDAVYNKASYGCLEVPVAAAPASPGATNPPPVLSSAAPGATGLPIESQVAGSASPGASAPASTEPGGSGGVASAAPSGPGSSPTPSDAGSAGAPDGALLAIGALVIAALLVGLFLALRRRRPTRA